MTRGLAFALLVIPASIVAFTIVGGVFQLITGFVAIIVPPIASWLYTKGAGAPVAGEARLPFILISAVAIVLGLFMGIAAATYSGFVSVAGQGGPFGSAYLRTLGAQFTTGFEDNLIPVLFGLGLGAVAIFSVLRGPRPAAGTAPSAPAAPETASAAPATLPSATLPSATLPSATLPSVPPTANTPSPGVMLNGKPLDPKQK